jgi:D-methionine transport system permease protein
MNSELILNAAKETELFTRWNDGTIPDAIFDTLIMVAETLAIGGILGLILGVIIWSVRKEGIFPNSVIYQILNFIVNLIRPIPFIIFITAITPATIAIVGTSLGRDAAVFPMIIFCTVATSRLVEQALINVPAGIIEAARSMGDSRFHILFSVLVREALAPLILSYAFLFIGVVDMSAMAGTIGGGGLGSVAKVYGYQKFDAPIMWICVGIIVVIVQLVQALANFLSKKMLKN